MSDEPASPGYTRCPECRYDLRGIRNASVCSECGAVIDGSSFDIPCMPWLGVGSWAVILLMPALLVLTMEWQIGALALLGVLVAMSVVHSSRVRRRRDPPAKSLLIDGTTISVGWTTGAGHFRLGEFARCSWNRVGEHRWRLRLANPARVPVRPTIDADIWGSYDDMEKRLDELTRRWRRARAEEATPPATPEG